MKSTSPFQISRFAPLTAVVIVLAVACGGTSSNGTNSDGSGDGGDSNTDGGSGGGGDGSSPGDGGATDGQAPITFPAGTVCNKSGHPLTPPTTLKHLIVILEENENLASVTGSANAPYMNSILGECGQATQYLDNCFVTDLDSLPHYLALTSGSNCNTGLESSGTGCITDDGDATSHTLSTTSIFTQVTSWKSYQEDMPSNCDQSTSGNYACKHNPPAYYSALSSCSTNDVPIAGVTCPKTTMTSCGTPSNALTTDLGSDTLPAFAFITPNLQNDMHNGTVTQGDNWMYTYLPLILKSPAYLRGEVAVYVLWDEQGSFNGGTTPNFFVSPYITAGTSSTTVMNHFAVLRSWENALGITTQLGCASGTVPGGGACPTGSTADVRGALGF